MTGQGQRGAPPGELDLSRLAHDLRGPVGVTRGHARLLLESLRGPLTDSQRQSIEAIERQATRLERLIESMEDRAPEGESGDEARAGRIDERAEPCERPRILVVEDDEDLLDVLSELLSERYDVVLANNGETALSLARSQRFELAIVDLGLPDLDGFELAERIAASDEARPPAFMFLSAQASAEAKVRGLALGAADYVTKPFDSAELLARIGRIVATIEREAVLRADALTDPLTGLANYRALAFQLHRELERARRYDLPVALVTIDLDDLKQVNDALGHQAGNDAIVGVARILHGAVRKFETVARQGGDEFAVLLPNTTAEEAMILAERLRAQVARHDVSGRPLSISVGVAARERGDPKTDVRSLVEESDSALYRAKRGGRNRVCGPAARAG